MKVRRLTMIALIALALLPGCKDEGSATPVVDSVALEAKIRAEVRAEIQAARARRVPPQGRTPITAGERAAIQAARSRRGADGASKGAEARANADEPTVVGQAGPSKLTAEDRRAGADDPARGRGLPAVKDLPKEDGKNIAPETGDTPEKADATEKSDAGERAAHRGEGTHLTAVAEGPAVRELAIALDIEDRQPVDVRAHFETVPERLTCFSIIASPDAPTTVTHRWRRGARVVQEISLNIGASPRWRTWSRQRIRPTWTGEWSCEVVDEAGAILGVTRVTLGGANAAPKATP